MYYIGPANITNLHILNRGLDKKKTLIHSKFGY